jgi:hypothetical protein
LGVGRAKDEPGSGWRRLPIAAAPQHRAKGVVSSVEVAELPSLTAQPNLLRN